MASGIFSLPYINDAFFSNPPLPTQDLQCWGEEVGYRGMNTAPAFHPSLFPLPPASSLCILRGRSSTLGAAEPRTANTKPGSLCSNQTGIDGWGSQFEALLLDELEVEATAVLALPVVATDLRM